MRYLLGKGIASVWLTFGVIVILLVTTFAETRAQNNPDPVTSTGAGAFTDFGYNPRAEAMGGAMVAVTSGEFQYAGYNPALSSFMDGYRATFSYAPLNLDRTLNFIAVSGTLASQTVDSTAPAKKFNAASLIHVQLGWLRASVNNIQAYDYEGDQIGTLTSAENEFLGNASVRISPRFGLGFAARFYYSTLPYPDQNFPSISSGGFGLDIGAVYQMRDNLTIGLAIQHLAAKYNWNSASLYGQLGSTTTDYFPITFRAGAAFFPVPELLVSLDLSLAERIYDSQDPVTTQGSASDLALGVEYQIVNDFFLRAGIKGIDLVNSLGQEVSESVGFGYTFKLEGLHPTIAYALLFDPITPGATQMIALSIKL